MSLLFLLSDSVIFTAEAQKTSPADRASAIANKNKSQSKDAKEGSQAEKNKTTVKENAEKDELAHLKVNEPLDPENYVIRPSDKVEIKVFGEEELNGPKTVDDAGVLTLDLVGRLKVAGKTVKEAEEFIQNKYEEDYLVDPQVALIVIEKAKRRFVILGKVRSPGFYEVPRSIRLDILQAIALAGGYTRIAGRVTIKRTTSRGEEILRYRLSKLRKKPKSEIPIVAEDDTVIVGESYF